jgi:hypothetical protein
MQMEPCIKGNLLIRVLTFLKPGKPQFGFFAKPQFGFFAKPQFGCGQERV